MAGGGVTKRYKGVSGSQNVKKKARRTIWMVAYCCFGAWGD